MDTKQGKNDEQCENDGEEHPCQPCDESGNEITNRSVVALSDSQHVGSNKVRNLGQLNDEKTRGAARMVGFMFWTSFACSILLFIGFATPGWLTITTVQKLEYLEYAFDSSGGYNTKTRYLRGVYQDYALWYITQCYDPGPGPECSTKTYSLLDAIYDRSCKSHSCGKIEIGSMEIEVGSSLVFFSESPLVFKYSEIVRAQVLYTVGLFLALCILYAWCSFRTDVSNHRSISFSKKKWIFLLILSIFSAVFVLVPVLTFAAIPAQIKEDHENDVRRPVGVVIAGFGGGMMALVAGAILVHLLCCRKENDVYICTCPDGSGLQDAEDVEET